MILLLSRVLLFLKTFEGVFSFCEFFPIKIYQPRWKHRWTLKGIINQMMDYDNIKNHFQGQFLSKHIYLSSEIKWFMKITSICFFAPTPLTPRSSLHTNHIIKYIIIQLYFFISLDNTLLQHKLTQKWLKKT